MTAYQVNLRSEFRRLPSNFNVANLSSAAAVVYYSIIQISCKWRMLDRSVTASSRSLSYSLASWAGARGTAFSMRAHMENRW